MITAAVNLTLLESLTLVLVCLIFGVAIYFFIKSRKTLHQTLKASRQFFSTTKQEEKVIEKTPMQSLEEQYIRMRGRILVKKETPELPAVKYAAPADENISRDLKQTITQQQKLLNTYLKKVEELEQEGREELKTENKELQREMLRLQQMLDHKDAELEELQEEVTSAKKMADRIEDVYREFDLLQEKMAVLENQAGRANELAIELEDTRHSYEVVHKELLRKQEKLEEVMNDNQRMRMQMDEVEDKLAESNLQRQQLLKKVQFLTDLNSDLQNISDTNKKLQTELRRIGELESMLNMMAEERDFLLRRKKDK
ncbi:MAG: hypothetical protein ACXWB9_07065 [Flavisolibacter sp.]